MVTSELSAKDVVKRYCMKDDVKTWLKEVRRKEKLKWSARRFQLTQKFFKHI